jgi:hypothetical protein
LGERTVMQEALFYEFNLERHVPADHLLRSIDRLSTWPGSAPICDRSTARSGGLRSIRS